jgi:acyl phosphate:glycerol-3-phosphate acyltransferase
VTFVISALLAYLIGGLPFGYWFVRLSYGKDIRTMGSGNIGATNVHRTAGGKAGLIVLVLDVLKGVIAVWLAGMISRDDLRAMAASGVCVMLGHCYPVFLRFRGGKAVACFIGAFGYLAPAALALTALVFFAIFGRTRYVSLSSIVGALAFPLAAWLTKSPQPVIVAGSVASVLVVYRHHANIGRLRAGTEPRFSRKGKAA